MFLPDDDSIYPDHVERVMNAILRSGAKIAHGNGLLRFVERTADGGWRTTGLNATLCSDTLTPSSALVVTPVQLNGVIQHRSVFDETGWFIDSFLNDVEIHMRQAQRYVFVHVDAMTFEFREHAGNSAKQNDFPRELQRLYDEVHPISGRPVLEQQRRASLQLMASREPGKPAFPPTVGIQ